MCRGSSLDEIIQEFTRQSSHLEHDTAKGLSMVTYDLRKNSEDKFFDRWRDHENLAIAEVLGAIEKEKRRCRSVPKVTKVAQRLERDGHIIKRLFNKEKEREKLWEFKMNALQVQEDKAMEDWHSPRISRRGVRATPRPQRTHRFPHPIHSVR